MDWKIFFTTFAAIFVAELGDKTQFAAMAAGANGHSLLSTWLGVVLALAVAGSIGVFAGSVLGHILSPVIMRWVSGLLFIAIGIWVLAAP